MSASAFSHINTSRCADVIHCISAAIHPDHATASQYIRRFFSEKQFDRIPKESSYEIFRRSHSFSEWHDHWAYRLQPVHSLRTGLEAQSFTGESVIHNSDLLRQKTHHGEKLVIERISPEQSSRNNQYAISSTRFSSAALLRKSRIRTALRSEAKQGTGFPFTVSFRLLQLSPKKNISRETRRNSFQDSNGSGIDGHDVPQNSRDFLHFIFHSEFPLPWIPRSPERGLLFKGFQIYFTLNLL